MSATIFINPETDTSIYTLFNSNTGGTNNTSVTADREISLDQLSATIDSMTNINDGDIIYILHPKYVTSITSTQITELTTYLTGIITGDIDIFYLTNFMDNCVNRLPLPTQPIDADIASFDFSYSVAPNGLGCVASTKAGWRNIINLAEDQKESYLSAKITSLVLSEKITAGTSQPLFVFPDITKNEDAIDSLYTQYCRIEKNFGQPTPNTDNIALFWFILGVVIIITFAWILSFYTPSNKIINL